MLHQIVHRPFNRTNMELKFPHPPCDSEGDLSFNRTNMELKLYEAWMEEAVALLLIEPIWN